MQLVILLDKLARRPVARLDWFNDCLASISNILFLVLYAVICIVFIYYSRREHKELALCGMVNILKTEISQSRKWVLL